jgi:hypothetical protein
MSGFTPFFFLLALSGTLAWSQDTTAKTPPAHPATRPQEPTPQKPLDWFRRADDLTNIRLPGSAPFHMKVVFHAYSGYDFAKPGQSTILTGDGTYEETWVAPEKWRRAVTLGSYHAVEIRADGKRTFEADSDYEPGRIMMLLSALLAPVPRPLLEPELDNEHLRWKLEHFTAGSIPWVRISFTRNIGHGLPEERAYDFLSNGILVRREEEHSGILTSWEGDQTFAGKLVPRHVAIRGAGLGRDMVVADVTIEPLRAPQNAISQVADQPADPGLTLRPLEDNDNEGASPIRFEPAGLGSSFYPADVKTTVSAVIDRRGMPREVELTSIRFYGQRPNPEGMDAVAATAERTVKAFEKDRFHPALVDGKPCQTYWWVDWYSGGH